jgi:lysyl-tRNA synthetase class 2
MKRLLAAGSGSIYQVCKVFRDGELGRLHNPEFTMVEWYRVRFGHEALMDEVEALVRHLLDGHLPLAASERLSYHEIFARHTGLEPHTATADDFARVAREQEIHIPADLKLHHDVAIWRDLLLTHLIEPRLGQGHLTFVYDYPASQAALARVRPGSPPLAERFELYVNGIELANGFHELADGAEQETRFERQQFARATRSLPPVPRDERLLAALEAGLPECSGVALGFDRLVMLATGARSIGEVLAFPLDRA